MIDRIKQGADEEKTELLMHLWHSLSLFVYIIQSLLMTFCSMFFDSENSCLLITVSLRII